MILIIITGIFSKSTIDPFNHLNYRLHTRYESAQSGQERYDQGLVPNEHLAYTGGCIQSCDDLGDDHCGFLSDIGYQPRPDTDQELHAELDLEHAIEQIPPLQLLRSPEELK